MSVRALFFIWLAMVAPLCFATDLIGQGQRVLAVQQKDQSVVVISIQEDVTPVTYTVDCIGATWGYEGGSRQKVVSDKRSQALAYRSCRDIKFKSSLVEQPGAWVATKRPHEKPTAVVKIPNRLNPEELKVPSDPHGRYYVIDISPYQMNQSITTIRIGKSGESYSLREIDCKQSLVRYLGTGDTLEEMMVLRPDPKLGDIFPEAIAYYVARRACRGVPDTSDFLR